MAPRPPPPASTPPAGALELRVATWNLEHLDDTNGAGCVGREDDDYATLAERIDALGVDVIAFQEVKNTAAAERVFDAEGWNVEVSARPSTGSGPPCYGRPEARLGHLATGIAVRAGNEYTRNADVSALAAGSRFRRWGTDVTVTRGGESLRVLSAHLKAGCWRAREDSHTSRESDCETLREQMEALADWIAARRQAGEPFVIAGDFNAVSRSPTTGPGRCSPKTRPRSRYRLKGASRAATSAIRSSSITRSLTLARASRNLSRRPDRGPAMLRDAPCTHEAGGLVE